MESECLPFSSIPHTSRLFDDFLHHFDKVRGFYARPPLEENWWEDEKKKISYPEARRRAVADVLERQNRAFGASEATLANIQRFREGAATVVTGQQVGLFGGPLFCVLKAISVAQIAEKAGAVPVFWLASEDHDFEEISFVNLPAADHLQKFAVNVPHPEGAPVGAIVFDNEITAAVQQVEAIFGKSQVSEWLAESYAKGATFSSAFAKFYARVLGELGIIFLDPLDRELHVITQPLYSAALEKSDEINQALQGRDQELESAGYHAQVKVTPSHTLCFYLEDGARRPIRHEGEKFVIGQRTLSKTEMLAETQRCPECFSANVLLRPVLEDYLLPTLCYSGGPSEVAYFAQVEVVYRHLAGRVTPVVPRIFATLIEPRQAKLLDRYNLKVTDVFVPPEKLREVLAAHALPQTIMKSFDVASEHLEKAVATIEPALEKLDKTLVDAAQNSAGKMRHQLQSLREKAARAEARKNSELQRHSDELSVLIYPNKELQEREVGAAYFLLKYGPDFTTTLKQYLKLGCPGHQILKIGIQGQD